MIRRASVESKARLVVSVLLLLMGIIALAGSRSLPIGTLTHVKPGFFPTVFGILVILLSLMMIAGLLLSMRKANSSDNAEERKAEQGLDLRGPAAMAGIFIVYVVLAYGVGYLIATAVALAGSGYLLGLRKWGLVVLIVCTSLATWVLFEWLLGISLPKGEWI